MRIWSLIATIVLTSLVSTSLRAQAPAGGQTTASPGQIPIAVIDVGYILKNHPTMKSEIESIETAMKAADEAMSRKRDAILKQMEELREKYTEGTPEYDREEKSIAEQDTNFRLELVKKRKEFDTARANVLFKVYTEITDWVAYLSKQMGVQVVLRVNREKMDPQKPETVQIVMSQDVLYFNQQVDFTDWVLQALNRRSGSKANTANAAGGANR